MRKPVTFIAKLLCFILFSTQYACYADHRFLIIANAYNNKNYYKEHIDSVAQQKYLHYRVIYCDDNSPDGSGKLAREYIATLPNRHKFTFIQNNIRRGQLANTYDVIHAADDDEIVVIADADDKLVHNKVLAYLNYVYTKNKLWMSYGQFKFNTNNKLGFARPYPPEVVKNGSFRTYSAYLLSHPRTYFVKLFKLIKLQDLLYENYFYLAATDPATMYPMAEMAGDHLGALDKVLYVYTYHNNLAELQIAMLKHIKQRPKYPRIQHLSATAHRSSVSQSVSSVLYANSLSYASLEKAVKLCLQSTQSRSILNTIYIIGSSLNKQQQTRLSASFKKDVSLSWSSTLATLYQALRYDKAQYVWILPSTYLCQKDQSPVVIQSCINYVQQSHAAGCCIRHSPKVSIGDRRPLAPGIYVLDTVLAELVSRDHSYIVQKKFFKKEFFSPLTGECLLSAAVPTDTVWLYYAYDQRKKSFSTITTWNNYHD